MNPSQTSLFTSSESRNKLGFNIAIVVALAYISVNMCRRLTVHVGPHAKLIVKFWFRQSWICAKFLKECCEMKTPVSCRIQQSFSSLDFVGWSELVFLHSSDHHDLWSLGHWQSGSWVATIDLADRLRGQKTAEIINPFTASWGCKYWGAVRSKKTSPVGSKQIVVYHWYTH